MIIPKHEGHCIVLQYSLANDSDKYFLDYDNEAVNDLFSSFLPCGFAGPNNFE